MSDMYEGKVEIELKIYHNQILQDRARDEPIPELPSNSDDSMIPRLLLNSTKPKDYAR